MFLFVCVPDLQALGLVTSLTDSTSGLQQLLPLSQKGKIGRNFVLWPNTPVFLSFLTFCCVRWILTILTMRSSQISGAWLAMRRWWVQGMCYTYLCTGKKDGGTAQ